MSRNILIVVLEPVPDEEIRATIETRKKTDDVNVHVVAPAAGIGLLKWLTGDEDEARAEAAELAASTAEAMDADVETEVGERDPILAVEDALRVFPADEILVAGSADGEIEEGLRRLGLPVSRLDGHAEEASVGVAPPEEGLAQDVARGSKAETPALLLGAVGGVVLAAVALISLIVFLVVWLV